MCQVKPPGSLPMCAPRVPGPVGGCASSDGPGLLDWPLASSLGLTWDLSAVQALPPRAYARTCVCTHTCACTHMHVHTAPPPRGLGGDLGGRCPPTASLAPSSEVGNELSCFLPSLFSGLLGEVTAHFACHGVCACHSPGSQLAVIGAGPAGMVFVWLVCCSCENWSPHL